MKLYLVGRAPSAEGARIRHEFDNQAARKVATTSVDGALLVWAETEAEAVVVFASDYAGDYFAIEVEKLTAGLLVVA